MMASVALEAVGKVYSGGVIAVRNLDLRVADGELLVLLGPSGCGKTTVLRLIAGLELPTEGQVLLDSRVVTTWRPRSRNVAMVFQNSALYPHYSVYRNLAFGLELRSRRGPLGRVWLRWRDPARAAELAVRRRGIRRVVQDTAELLAIGHLLDRKPRQLSGGERQRVALGRALVRQPAVFLLDEPLSDLDGRLRYDLCRQLRELHGRLRVTMVFVTHDQTEALTLGDRVAVMNEGCIRQLDVPQEIYDHPRDRFVATFVGSPPMNLCGGLLVPGSGASEFRGGGLAVRLPGVAAPDSGRPEAVELGVRPESIRLLSGAEPVEVHGRGMVTGIESRGDHRLVQVDLDGAGPGKSSPLVCKMGSEHVLKTGCPVAIQVDTDRVHLFDASTGVAWNLGTGIK